MDATNPEIKKNGDTSQASKTIPIVNINTSNTNVAATNKVNEDVKYQIEDLIANSKALTGYSKEVAVGALFECKGKELMKADFKKAVKDFLGKKVE